MNPSFLGLLPPFLAAAFLASFFRRLVARHRLTGLPFLPVFLATVSFGALTVLLTEVLGAFSALSPGRLGIAWTVAAAVLLVFERADRRRNPSAGPRFRASVGRSFRRLVARDRLAGLLLPILVCVLLLTLTAAAVYPPNNYDSMIYHVARVMHWAQQGSVAHYPTSILLQLQTAPLAEYFLLHLYLLTGSDALFNLVQWLSLLLVILAVYAGAELTFRRAGLTASVLASTLPMAVLQASSTQNDLVTAAWLAVAVCLGLGALRRPKVPLLVPFTGLALGLAAATKPTALLISAPFVAAFFCGLLYRRVRVRALVLSATLIGLPSLPFLARNFDYFGSPYGPNWELPNEPISLAGTASVAIRNVALHSQVPLPGAFFEAADAGALGFLRACHGVLGIPVDDSRYTFKRKDAFLPNDCGLRRRGNAAPFHEDCTGNPLHLLLFLGFLPFALAAAARRPRTSRGARRRLRARRAGILMAAAAISFLMIAAYLKWQPWGARLDLPLFVVACVPLGVLASGLRGALRGILVAFMAGLAIAAVCLNAIRPVSARLLTAPIDRRASYFANRPDLLRPYSELVRAIRASGCRRIGYQAGREPFEYPFWVLLGEGGYAFRFEHVGVAGTPWRDLRDPAFKPCAVISAPNAESPNVPFQLFLGHP